MKKTISVSIAVLMLTSFTRAQGPPAPLHDPFLDHFVGDWRVERKMGNGRTEQTSVHGEWVLKHQFIQVHYGSAEAALEYQAFVFVGFDEAAKNYVCHWVDVFGGHYSELGRGKIDPNLISLEFRFVPKNGELTNKFMFDPQTKTWTSLIRQQEKGEWKTFAEEKWTRVEDKK